MNTPPIDFSALAGRELPGGCDRCDATQRMTQHPTIDGAWHLEVVHEDRCPALLSMKARSN